ncbi:kinesin-like protein NACK1 isoform X1 [Nicotiana tabacum]|uniref:Kinesin-like protein NACK1 n=5 Tax=Nicotiana TaxID=4085 RepID=KN7A_TOBAC|nr:kinesin-like protein NACK1 [Nicotiana tabacum]XP_009804137.1 PREDICTED: kinesin-like protein NACK1 [Nicotiana sylvestris]XP_009804138.1 PREDICTED: kinesin-like protein NACK1 [Nicotiana sylvestris]XP_009804139.1 PREDICTED: kinesin-like protein NACK1 [Nicotiana sylvestris]XP_016456327.1 PREDICTED: kinesin-like protein NACK1 [Nicotiana tabacum]Q8S950.1 RecName: Full=Kinesin-like protein NACK1; AltName: Full=NPK1-activating kinesin-1 [Nicotiana tabacum]BAB86283.1 kinesin-like protein NACK1 [Ni
MTVRTPGTPASKIDKTPATTPNGHRGREEKIVVTVRLRPLNKRELSAKDHAAWECIDDHTIIYRPVPQERAAQPASSFTFDKVFGPDSITEAVYEEGVKNVALSSLMGINATIFAYGQTSSGKTYTMRGITEKAVNDIYAHIMSTPEREFRIRISGLEIYNENVRDLLNSESGRSLKLLDDPEKGTVVEKLVEETASNDQHLRHLISICEAQRQVGETALNDTSSRSHQIIRLTIESTLRESSDCVRSYVASLNFVDLAGSERASQTNADGARLREGCHINLSLMTLTTVIRKLSVGKRSGHIPYRDSKLTRILQHSLGGNARTAIICTLSPASSHVEQSRNTLYFATRAKEVTNNAQVNMVVSDKQLVKHLQKEVARLEAELRTPDPANEKDWKIQQMEMEIEELKRQRDLAQSQVDELRRKLQEEQGPKPSESVSPVVKKCLSFSGTLSPNLEEKAPVRSERTRNTMGRQSMRQSLAAPFTLMHEIRKLEHLQEQLGDEANRALEVLQKEVACHRLGNQDAAETIAKLQAEIREMRSIRPLPKEVEVGSVVAVNKSVSANLKEEIARLHSQGSTIADLEEQLENVQKSLDKLVMSLPSNNDQQSNNDTTQKAKHPSKKKKLLPLTSSNSINRQNFLKSPCSPLSTARQVLDCEVENRAPDSDDLSCEIQPDETPTKSDGGDVSSKEGTPYRRSSSVNMRKMQKMFQEAAEENVRNIRSYVTELKERVAKLQYQKQLLVCQVLELEANEAAGYNLEDDENIHQIPEESPVSWQITFKEQRQQIIDLWDVCYVSIIHRSQFYLLFKGDPADEIYLEVELRRLTWLQQHLAELGNATPARVGNEPTVSLSSSIRALKREREFLAKRLTTRLTAEERDYLYIKWEVPLEGKQRRMQFINKLWTNPHDAKHVHESAEIVAKLVGFCEGGNMSREMFELNFVLPSDRRPWFAGWNQISDLLHI